MKPELPREIQMLLPEDIVWYIRQFVPHLPKKSPTSSPNLHRELERIQRSPLRGKNAMYLKGFDDFVLD